MWAFFAISIILVVIAVVYMLTVFPAKGITMQVKFVTGYAWLTTLMICCIVPLDVVATLHGEKIDAISVLWDIPYWSTQALTWFLIPVYMEYSIAGEFTWAGRMWRAIRSNLLFYCLMASIGAAGLLWGTARGSLDLESLPALGMQLSNTFGLVCVLALMGFGLVNIPRSFWKHSNPEALLRYKYYELGKIMEERDNAAKNLNGAIEKVLATKRILGRNEREALQHIADMLTFIREHTGEDVEAGISASVDSCDYADELPQLHAEVMKEVYHMGAIQARALHTIKKAIWLSEVRATRAGFWCFVWPYVLKLLSVVTLCLGALILWCEVTIGFEEDMSPLSKLIHSIHGEFFDQAVIMAFMVYVIACTYNAFFAIGLGSLYMLTPGASTSFSLLFNGTLMARFAAPLCFNYLHVIRMNTAQHGQFTTFAQKMGLDVPSSTTIPFLAIGFNQWAPWLLMVVVALVGSNALGLIYRYVLCCLPQGYASNEDDEDSNRYVMEGERLVERERLNVEQGRGLSDSVRLLNSAAYVSSAPVTLSRTGPPSRAGVDPFTRLKQDRQSLSQSRLLANTSPLAADNSTSARQTSILGSLLPKNATGVQSPSGSMSAGLLSDSSSPPSAATELARKYGRASKKS